MADSHPTQTSLFPDSGAAPKTCKKCGVAKPVGEFNRNPKMRSGRLNTCRDCDHARVRQLRVKQMADFAAGNVTTIRCCDCRQVKPLDAFGKNVTGKYGFDGMCKECRARNTKSHRNRLKKNPEWRRKAHRQRRDYNLRNTYGLTRPEYEAMATAQNGLCAICGEPEIAVKSRKDHQELKELSVDHCHRTGKVRSLLCQRCNNGLGGFRDNPEFLKAAIAYLERHRQEGN